MLCCALPGALLQGPGEPPISEGQAKDGQAANSDGQAANSDGQAGDGQASDGQAGDGQPALFPNTTTTESPKVTLPPSLPFDLASLDNWTLERNVDNWPLEKST